MLLIAGNTVTRAALAPSSATVPCASCSSCHSRSRASHTLCSPAVVAGTASSTLQRLVPSGDGDTAIEPGWRGSASWPSMYADTCSCNPSEPPSRDQRPVPRTVITSPAAPRRCERASVAFASSSGAYTSEHAGQVCCTDEPWRSRATDTRVSSSRPSLSGGIGPQAKKLPRGSERYRRNGQSASPMTTDTFSCTASW
eukprot:4874665-Prymnesium_polylepis.2